MSNETKDGRKQGTKSKEVKEEKWKDKEERKKMASEKEERKGKEEDRQEEKGQEGKTTENTSGAEESRNKRREGSRKGREATKERSIKTGPQPTTGKGRIRINKTEDTTQMVATPSKGSAESSGTNWISDQKSRGIEETLAVGIG